MTGLLVFLVLGVMAMGAPATPWLVERLYYRSFPWDGRRKDGGQE